MWGGVIVCFSQQNKKNDLEAVFSENFFFSVQQISFFSVYIGRKIKRRLQHGGFGDHSFIQRPV